MYPLVNIDEEIIKVSTLTIGGRRMTKAVFTQIIQSLPFDQQLNFVAHKVKGFVNDGKTRWLLYIWKDQIRKYSLTSLIEFSQIYEYTDYVEFNNIANRLRLGISEDTSDAVHLKDHFSKDSWQYILKQQETAKVFLNSLDSRQIFIAA